MTRVWEIPQWGNVTLIEVVWLLSGLVGVLFCLLHLRPLWLDYRTARRISAKKTALRIVAWSYFRREVVRIVQSGVIAAFGVWGALEPPFRPGPAYVSLTGIILTAAFLALNFSVALMSWWDFKTRREVKEHLANETTHRLEIGDDDGASA